MRHEDGATENAGVENSIRSKKQEWKMRKQIAGTENAGVENALAVWKAEPILFSETALSYFLKIVLRLLSEYTVIFIAL